MLLLHLTALDLWQQHSFCFCLCFCFCFWLCHSCVSSSSSVWFSVEIRTLNRKHTRRACLAANKFESTNTKHTHVAYTRRGRGQHSSVHCSK